MRKNERTWELGLFPSPALAVGGLGCVLVLEPLFTLPQTWAYRASPTSPLASCQDVAFTRFALLEIRMSTTEEAARME